MGYRNRLKTCLTMFMEPWLQQASQRNGYVSTNWNQTRGSGGGTRTGRPSTSNPNFLNISKTWEDKNDGYVHPGFLPVAPLPLVRSYILPDPGCVFLHRDFDGQELRVFAHYECGELQEAYRRDAATDPHAFVGAKLMEAAGREFTRSQVKGMNFQAMYGGGVNALATKLKVSYDEAKGVKAFHDQALPGRKMLNDAIKTVIERGDPIRTWGGRLYFAEQAKEIDGRRQDFLYTLINYLIQGSAADITKEALIQWHDGTKTARFLVTVYDEINISAPTDFADDEMAWLKEVMERDWLDVPMRSSGKRGPNWGALEKCK
jgi:DNA polymerase I-like protein with 3'-5' exonuclease and polymerase domains